MTEPTYTQDDALKDMAEFDGKHFFEPTYTKADIEAARAMALGEAALAAHKVRCNYLARTSTGTLHKSWVQNVAKSMVGLAVEDIRALSPDAAAILAERDRDMKAQVYREALEDVKDMAQRYGAIVAEDIEAIANPYEGKR